MENSKPRWSGIVMVILGAASFGLLSPIVKMAYNAGFDVIRISVVQVTFGTALAWLLTASRPKEWVNPLKEPWWQLSLVGIFGLVLTTFFYNAALHRLDASLAIVMLFQFTWMTVAFDFFVGKRKPNRYQLFSVAIVLAGTLLAVGINESALQRVNSSGIALGLVSAFTYSLFLYFTGRIETSMPTVQKSAVMVTGALPILYLMYPPRQIFQGDIGELLQWGFILGLVGQLLPTVFFNAGIPRVGGTLSSLLASIELPVAMIAAFLILGEPVGGLQWLGMLLILGGIVFAERRS